MKRMKVLAAVLVVLAVMTGCVGKSGNGTPQEVKAGERVFTDSVGRNVILPENITKIAVTGPMAQMLVYSLAPELLVGWSSRWSVDVQGYIPEEYLELPVLGQLYGSRGELNLEELLAAGPDVVVDIGETGALVGEDMDALSLQTGIPFVHIGATTQTMGDAYRKLGELTGLTKRAEEYALYCENTYDMIVGIMNSVGAENKIRSLYCLGDAGCNVIAKGSYQSEIIDLITDNIAVVDSPSAKGTGNEVDIEQILTWNPEFIIFAPDSIYDTAASDPAWQQVGAIQSGSYTKVPFGPYNWLGFPPSVQRYLGMLWLTATLYPEYCDYDLETEVKAYYRMFYHIELSDGQYAALTSD